MVLKIKINQLLFFLMLYNPRETIKNISTTYFIKITDTSATSGINPATDMYKQYTIYNARNSFIILQSKTYRVTINKTVVYINQEINNQVELFKRKITKE